MDKGHDLCQREKKFATKVQKAPGGRYQIFRHQHEAGSERLEKFSFQSAIICARKISSLQQIMPLHKDKENHKRKLFGLYSENRKAGNSWQNLNVRSLS